MANERDELIFSQPQDDSAELVFGSAALSSPGPDPDEPDARFAFDIALGLPISGQFKTQHDDDDDDDGPPGGELLPQHPAELVFWQPHSNDGQLVFADGPRTAPPVASDFGIDINLPLPVSGSFGVGLGFAADIPLDLPVNIQIAYGSNVNRSGLSWTRQHAQTAHPASVAVARSAWQQSRPASAMHRQRAQPAQPLNTSSHRAHWQATLPLPAQTRARWQKAMPLAAPNRAAFQRTISLHTSFAQHAQLARHISSSVRAAYQSVIQLRSFARAHIQPARPIIAHSQHQFFNALPLQNRQRPHFQTGRHPIYHWHPIDPEQEQELCYCPETLGQLVFTEPWEPGGELVFICQPCITPPDEPEPEIPAAIVIARRRSYIVINSIELRRADNLDGPALPSEAFAMQIDRDSWTWSWSATFHRAAKDAVTPSAGQTIEIEARINDQPFRLQIERVGRSARFPERLIKVSGRSKAAILDQPHAPVQGFANNSQMTAHQLMTDVLTVNGVGMGWAVDFGLDDWIIPADVFAHHGTWASAINEIASAAGGYVQPHDTDSVLRVLPLWPQPWWRWDMLTPDIELPAGFAEVEETEYIDKPNYNRAIIHGQADGIIGDYKREGTAGNHLREPVVIHPLITAADAARQRAIAELSDTGRIINHQITVMILPQTGVIKPGHILRYIDDDAITRLGIVRSSSINWQFPVLTQTLGVESHE